MPQPSRIVRTRRPRGKGEDAPDIRRVVPQFSGERTLAVVDGEIGPGPGEQCHQEHFPTMWEGALQDLLETIAA